MVLVPKASFVPFASYASFVCCACCAACGFIFAAGCSSNSSGSGAGGAAAGAGAPAMAGAGGGAGGSTAVGAAGSAGMAVALGGAAGNTSSSGGASLGGNAGTATQAGAPGTAGTAGAAGSATSACGTGTATSSDVVVNLTQNQQTMDGFGVSNAYQSTAITDAQADQFFDKDKGIGLSIFRLGIKNDGTSWGPIGDAVKAAARGAVVWAAPWTPPANCKSNTSLTNGGHLNTSCYDSWSSTLAAFPAKAKQSGVTVTAISVQNEPDNVTQYESCIYSGDEMVAFIKVLGPKLKALNPPVKLLGPESTRWEHLWSGDYNYGTLILADPEAAAAVDILATHMYETQDAVAPPAGLSKPIWETEMSGVMGYPEEGPSSDIANGLAVAGWIHDAIAVGQASAWHAWWITSLNMDNEGLLLNGGGTTKRLYTLGNFSKFVRPGYKRVTVSGPLPTGVKVTAYTNPSDGTVVVVAINTTTAAVPASFFLSGAAPCSMTPWVTSATDDLASKSAVAISAGHLSPMLAAQSVTTFVGKP